MRSAFTMIELVFVIVVLGILAGIAIPKLAATRDDAVIASGRADIAAIRSGIITERQQRLFRGNTTFTPTLDGAGTGVGVMLFTNVTAQGRISGNGDGDWIKITNANAVPPQYTYSVLGQNVVFEYNQTSGTFNCDRTNGTYGTQCQYLTE